MKYINELKHHGIKGMRWGVRRAEKKAINQAKKDAKEFARAKMFYGEGAGTRRKLIKNTVKERQKDPIYKKAFEEALNNQNMAEHVSKAKSERVRKDTVNNVKKTGKSIVNAVTGHPERLGATMAAMYGIYTIGNKTGINSKVINKAKGVVDAIKLANDRRHVMNMMNRGL